MPLLDGATKYDEKVCEKIREAYDILEAFLVGRTWLAGEQVTIADMTNAVTVITLDLSVPVEEKRSPKLFIWLQRCKELPHFEECNKEGTDLLKISLQELLRP